MFITAHIAIPYIVLRIVLFLMGVDITFSQSLLFIFFCVLPDLDVIYWVVTKRKLPDNNFRHRRWVSHLPITYSFLFLLLIKYPTLEMLLIILGVYSHLFLDTFASADGIMWFYPKSKRFFTYFNKGMQGIHGVRWITEGWKKTVFYKIDLLLFPLSIMLLFLF